MWCFAESVKMGRFVSVKTNLVKIENLIVQHLYQNRQVTLQGIGTITLAEGVVLPGANDKDFQLPENAFQFEFDRKAGEDEALILFIVAKTRKIRPLASADLDSFLALSKQFLNIGKPLMIEGVGTIQKDQSGNYVFIQGLYQAPRIDELAPVEIKEKREESVSFDAPRKKDNSRKYLIGIAAVVLLALLGLSIMYVLRENEKDPVVDMPVDQPVLDTPTPVRVDTPATPKPDSNQVAQPTPVSDSVGFSVAIKYFKTEANALKSLEKLKSYGHERLELRKIDSTQFVLVLPFSRPKRDSLLVRDSLKRFFGGEPRLMQ